MTDQREQNAARYADILGEPPAHEVAERGYRALHYEFEESENPREVIAARAWAAQDAARSRRVFADLSERRLIRDRERGSR